MITTKELYEWKETIKSNNEQAKQQLNAYKNDEGMRNYYLALIRVTEAQLSMLYRMIRQSEENDKAVLLWQ